MDGARKIRTEKLRERQYAEKYARSHESKKVKWEVKWGKVERWRVALDLEGLF